MQEAISSCWNKIKNQLDIWFFLGFLLTFPLGVRKVLFFYPIRGVFNEYAGAYLYISDIFLALTVLSLLCNNVLPLSIYRRLRASILSGSILYIPLLLAAFSFISIFWSQNQVIALYRSIKLMEAYGVYLYVVLRFIPRALFHVEQLGSECQAIVPRGTIGENIQPKTNCSTWNNFLTLIIALGSLQAILAIGQFIAQHSIGLYWLKESVISPDIPGVAKIILSGHKYIRAYGLFPHPNILGGFLLFSIVATMLYKKHALFQAAGAFSSCGAMVGQLNQGYQPNVPRGTLDAPRALSDSYFSPQKVELKKLWLIYGALVVQGLALLATFSKSAGLGLLLTLTFIGVKSNCSTWNNLKKIVKELLRARNKPIVPRGTIPSSTIALKPITDKIKLFHVEQFRRGILIVLIALALLFIIKPDINALLFKSLGERLYYLKISNAMIVQNVFWGVGSGEFVLDMPRYTKNAIELWQFQPVHNVFILIWSELGILGLFLFGLFLLKMFHVEHFEKQKLSIVPRGTIESQNSISKSHFCGQKIKLKIRRLVCGKSIGLGLFGGGPEEACPDNTRKQNETANDDKLSRNILCNNYYYLSTKTIYVYFQGILLGFIFIMLFDHYFWDIWPGQILFWLVVGVIAGLGGE